MYHRNCALAKYILRTFLWPDKNNLPSQLFWTLFVLSYRTIFGLNDSTSKQSFFNSKVWYWVLVLVNFNVSWRFLYLIASILNSISMMASSSLFITLLFLSTFWILSEYHILMMMFLLASICTVSLLVKTCTFLLGIKSIGIDTVHWKHEHKNLITRIGKKIHFQFYFY